MEQTVYIDVFFLVNFSMDFLGLFLAASLLGKRRSALRLLLSAIFGGAYACFALIAPLDEVFFGFSFLLDAFSCLIMSAIAVFERRAWRGIFSFAVVFGALSILLGGAMTALFYAFNRLGLDKAFNGGATDSSGDGISVWLFAFLATISGFMALIGGKFLKRKGLRQCGAIEIEYRGRTVCLECATDSGNLLREPISQLPCILVELDAMRGVLSSKFCDCVRRGELDGFSAIDASRIRIVPARTASGDAMLIGIRPDRLRLDMGKGYGTLDAYVVFSCEKISALGARALIPSELALGAA